MKIILMTAYDINPFKGSEAATGSNFTLQIARLNKVVAITRQNNQEPIELNYLKSTQLYLKLFLIVKCCIIIPLLMKEN